jgi:conjugal transfer/type IV secretion protein DotA/TraY
MGDISSIFQVPASDWSYGILNAFFSMGTVLTQLLFFYNTAVAAAAATMLLYVTTHAIVDTAHLGKPMGNFSEVWLPIRMGLTVVLAVPLPTQQGFNAAQEIIYYAAKYGIGAADQAWSLSLEALTTSASPIIVPPSPQADELAQGLFMAEVCMAAANTLAQRSGTAPWVSAVTFQNSGNWLTGGGAAVVIAYGGNRSLGFGEAACGGISLTPQSAIDGSSPAASIAQGLLAAHQGAEQDLRAVVAQIAQQLVQATMTPGAAPPLPGSGNLPAAIGAYGTRIAQQAGQVSQGAQGSALASFQTQATQDGWAAAGAYLMRISDINAMILNAAAATPRAIRPRLGSGFSSADHAEMERVLSIATQWWNAQVARQGSSYTANNALLAGQDTPSILARFGLRTELFQTFVLGPANALACNLAAGTPSLACNTTTNPIASLVAMGHHMVDSFWVGLIGVATINGGLEGVKEAANATDSQILTLGGSAYAAAAAGAAGKIFETVGFFVNLILLSFLASGIWYAYILPAIPFIYWFYGVTGWLIRIAMGMLAGPVWAASHLSPEGSGAVSGQSMAGYTLLAETFLQPIIMVITLYLAYAVMYAMAGYFYPYFQTTILHSLSGHVDLFTGAIAYMILGAVLLSGMMVGVFSMISKATGWVIAMAGLRASGIGEHVDGGAESAQGSVGQAGRTIEGHGQGSFARGGVSGGAGAANGSGDTEEYPQ